MVLNKLCDQFGLDKLQADLLEAPTAVSAYGDLDEAMDTVLDSLLLPIDLDPVRLNKRLPVYLLHEYVRLHQLDRSPRREHLATMSLRILHAVVHVFIDPYSPSRASCCDHVLALIMEWLEAYSGDQADVVRSACTGAVANNLLPMVLACAVTWAAVSPFSSAALGAFLGTLEHAGALETADVAVQRMCRKYLVAEAMAGSRRRQVSRSFVFVINPDFFGETHDVCAPLVRLLSQGTYSQTVCRAQIHLLRPGLDGGDDAPCSLDLDDAGGHAQRLNGESRASTDRARQQSDGV
jgi:hypothetical protein